ncbi:MAG: PfkB family carbohydrate kinase [Ignavibacterium album]|jgi:fructokinase|uniref:PfkB family carbohydrate kinase n=1 Tax=Ignavibacterium album TaxID=591197 RepID=UPI0026F1FE8F|nr:PfkB family carbohydrate kinase [Ignavibacterium album]MCX8104819.1 PfkB family carbohydrate kinase [Ignavibacterium album]
MKITSIGEILFDLFPNHKRLGGAPLNFLFHIYKLTGEGNIISRVGKDVLGTKAIDEIKFAGISTDYIQVDRVHPTGVANVILDTNGNPEFEIDTDRAFDYLELTDDIKYLVSNETNCLYFGTLAQRSEISRNSIQALFNNQDIKYFCDLNLRNDFYDEEIISESLKTADFLKVNYKEMGLLNDLITQIDYNTEKVAYELMDQFNISMIAVTRGKDGSTIFENGKRYDYTSVDVKVKDTTGAGDAFAAMLCLGYLQGLEINRINKLANDFAGEICMIDGAIPKNDRIYDNFRELIGIF